MRRISYSSASHRLSEAITQLLCESFGTQYRDYYLLQLEYLATPKTSKIIADQQGDPIAFTQVVDYGLRIEQGNTPLKAAYLYSVCTRKSYRGQGIMKHFIEELLSELRLAGYAIAFLVPAEIWLIDFYKRLGFQWQGSDIFAKAPLSSTPLIYPGEEAKAYLKAVRKIEPQEESQATYEARRREEWQPLNPPVLGWMAVPLTSEIVLTPTPYLLQPLT